MQDVSVTPAREDEFLAIENMLQFYMHDFSEWIPVPFAADGKFSISPKAGYLGAEKTHPFVIRVGGQLAGFAIADDEVMDAGMDYSLGYFFVARPYRGRGVARYAMEGILRQLPGKWEIFHFSANQDAGRFWAKAVPLLSRGAFFRGEEETDGLPCVIYRFETSPDGVSA